MSSGFKIFIRSSDLSDQMASNVQFQMNRARMLDGQWEVALVGGQMVNSVANVSAAMGNNTLRYSTDDGVSYTTITLPDGSYQTSAIEAEVHRVLAENGDTYDVNGITKYKIDFSVSLYQMRVEVYLHQDTRLDLTTGGLHQILGFGAVELDGGASGDTFTAPNVAKFTDPSLNYFITTDLIYDGIYINNQLNQGVLKIVSGGIPGYGISFKDPSGIYDYFPVNRNILSDFKITILDNLGRVADLRGEQTNFELHFRPMK